MSPSEQKWVQLADDYIRSFSEILNVLVPSK
ncbi:hypothetical protein [Alkalihalobacterium alkalinitrilicum]|nr:hypothetical protein [Alkalihalobacterium alkalinitrilicum]